MIESDDFGDTLLENERLISGSRVILCTTSMLSGSRLTKCGFPKIIPVRTVIIDEASQIEAGDYLPILVKYKTTLRKIIFIGDDKQCRCEEYMWMKSWYTDNGSSGPLRTGTDPGTEECVRVAAPQAGRRLPRYSMYVQCFSLPPKLNVALIALPW